MFVNHVVEMFEKVFSLKRILKSSEKLYVLFLKPFFAVVDSHHLLHLVYLFWLIFGWTESTAFLAKHTPELVALPLAAAICVSHWEACSYFFEKASSMNLVDSHGP